MDNKIDEICEYVNASAFGSTFRGEIGGFISEFYSDKAFDPPGKLCELLDKIADIMPDDQNQIGQLCDSTPEAKIKFLILRAGLLTTKDSNVWLHHRIVRILVELSNLGVAGLRLPALLHSMLALTGGNINIEAAPLFAEVAASSLRELSAIEGRERAIEAIDLGSELAIWALHKIDVRWTRKYETRADLNLVEKHRGQSSWLKEDASRKIAPVHTFSGNEVHFDPPAHGGQHFVYRRERQDRVRPNIDIYSIRGGHISIRHEVNRLAEFYVFDRDGNLLTHLSRGLRPFRAERTTHLPGRMALLSDHFSQRMNICHFLLDHLARDMIYRSYDSNIDNKILLHKNNYVHQALGYAGLSDNAVYVEHGLTELKADELIVSSNLFEHWCHPSQFADLRLLSMFRSWVAGVEDREGTMKAPKRIFISRNDATSRKIVNQSEIDVVLEEFEFTSISLSNLTLAEQIQIFANAEAVVGVHGAGLTNIVFGSRSLRVLEIIPPMVATDAYWLVARSLSQNYDALIGYDLEFGQPDYNNWSHRPELNDRDMYLAVSEFRDAVQLLVS